MFIETKFEVHVHNAKFVTFVGQNNFERGMFMGLSRFKLSKYSLRIPKNIPGPNESLHCSMQTQNCCFCAYCCTGPFTVRELFTSSDSSPRNIMSNKHTNSIFYLECIGSHHGSICAN